MIPNRFQPHHTTTHTTTHTAATNTGSGPAGTPADLLTPAEVAALFRVDPKTVTRWAKTGRLTWIRTLGGHRRYPAAQIHALLAGQQAVRTVVHS